MPNSPRVPAASVNRSPKRPNSMDERRLIYMANQIARNLATVDDPVTATAEHITLFWDPRMKARLRACDRGELSPIAARAVDRLAEPHG